MLSSLEFDADPEPVDAGSSLDLLCPRPMSVAVEAIYEANNTTLVQLW